ncbi:MAG: YciI family protein [Oryzihumus sp.]
MPRYLISFEKGAMDHVTQEEIPEVGRAAHAVCQEAKDAGVFVFAGGLGYDDGDVEHAVVATDGMVADGPYPESRELIGGVAIVDVPTREAALEWAAKFAVACGVPKTSASSWTIRTRSRLRARKQAAERMGSSLLGLGRRPWDAVLAVSDRSRGLTSPRALP